MKINTKKLMRQFIYFIFIYMMVINCLCDTFHIPTIVRYIPDILLPFIILYVFKNIKILLNNKKSKVLTLLILLFLFHCILSSAVNANSIFYFIWGFRNLFRFLIIMLCAILVFDEEDKEQIINIIHKMFIINVFVCFLQYFALGLWGDAIGGTFKLGDTGGNSGVIYLIIIENALNIVNYLNKKISIKKVFASLLLSVLIAVFAELKVVYIFIVFIILLALLLNKFSLKTVIIISCVIITLFVGYNILEKVDPSTAELINIEGLMDYAGGEEHGYSSKYDISRVRAFSQINKYFFHDNIKERILGYGLGHCDVSSSFEIFNSAFGKQYNDILHHTWFSHAMLYLETGLIGYLMYIFIFIYILIYCYKQRKKNKSDISLYNAIIIITVMTIIMTWYNSILRNDISYFVYIFLILPFICHKESKNIESGIEKTEKKD